MFITGFVLVSFLPAVCKEFGIAWNGHLTMPMMSGYLIYPILGYLLAITSLKKWHRIVIYLLGISSAILRYVMTYILSSADGTINKLYFSYTEYYALFLASAVFVFLKYSDVVRKITESRLGSKVIPQMASLSFGVYLSHMIIYRKLTHIIVENTWQWRLLVPFLIYAICLGISYCIRKIPIIKRIIP